MNYQLDWYNTSLLYAMSKQRDEPNDALFDMAQALSLEPDNVKYQLQLASLCTLLFFVSIWLFIFLLLLYCVCPFSFSSSCYCCRLCAIEYLFPSQRRSCSVVSLHLSVSLSVCFICRYDVILAISDRATNSHTHRHKMRSNLHAGGARHIRTSAATIWKHLTRNFQENSDSQSFPFVRRRD